jgi:NRAMP (natural resistance-associated macrophage protein)-like metal ion transporter
VRRRSGLIAFLAVVGPGLLAGLSDDDPAGITTYSILGADHGYRLLWVLTLSTAALILFHGLGARMGIVTGQGLAGLMRQRYGIGIAGGGLVVLIVANVGTTCAEFAGVAAGLELAGVSRYVSVPVAAIVISALVLRGSFRRVEHVLLALSAIFVTYVVSAFLAHPDWGAAVRGLVVPSPPSSRDAILAATATVGTTLAPWGLAFIQSFAVDKHLTVRDLRYERFDVVTGAVLTGIIGFFVVVAAAATLHSQGRTIHDAGDAAVALEPLAGSLAATMFGAGLVGAGLLAASILPLSTAYSVSETLGYEAALDDRFSDARLFYVTYGVVVVLAVSIVLIPSAPLVPILFLSQALNAVLLLPLLALIYGIVRDPVLMGDHATDRREAVAVLGAIVLLAACVIALAVLSIA